MQVSYREDRQYSTPGVFFEEETTRRPAEFRTGVPALFGFSRLSDAERGRAGLCPPQTLTGWRQFGELPGATPDWGFLPDAVRGFFENGGAQCVVVTLPLDEVSGAAPEARSEEEIRKAFESLASQDFKQLYRAFESLESLEDVDLICFPDLVRAGERMLPLQKEILSYCTKSSGRFAILDSQPTQHEDGARGRSAQTDDLDRMKNHWRALPPMEGALYYPWIRVRHVPHRWIPPCGHIAGIYARTDMRVGVHKAPANEIVEGAIDLEVSLNDREQGDLNDVGVNCLRYLPGRGIRVWGARTLCGLPESRYINVRRLFLTLVRWIDHSFGDLVFEPYTPALWEKIRGRLNGFCYNLFQAGALNGLSAAEAYYVKCDAEINPPDERNAGRVISHVGLAALAPAEFIVVRIAHSAAGSTLAGSTGPLQERR